MQHATIEQFYILPTPYCAPCVCGLRAQTAVCSASLVAAGGAIEDRERIAVINSTVNIARRLSKFYDMVQEILDQLQTCTAHIAS